MAKLECYWISGKAIGVRSEQDHIVMIAKGLPERQYVYKLVIVLEYRWVRSTGENTSEAGKWSLDLNMWWSLNILRGVRLRNVFTQPGPLEKVTLTIQTERNYVILDNEHETSQISLFLLSVAFHRGPRWWMRDFAERLYNHG